MNNDLTITITGHNAMLIHFALVEYVKHICKDEYELREIDKKLGYSGDLEEYNITNREKYIDSMTDKELALFLSCGSQIIDNQIDTNPSLTDDEEIRKQVARNCDEIEKWLSREVKKSADEMFEELGYKKVNRWCCDYVFDRKNGNGLDRIVIDKTKHGYYYIKHRILYDKYFYEQYAESNTISEVEDKAIHKKIEELKNER